MKMQENKNKREHSIMIISIEFDKGMKLFSLYKRVFLLHIPICMCVGGSKNLINFLIASEIKSTSLQYIALITSIAWLSE